MDSTNYDDLDISNPSTQLYRDLETAITTSLSTNRPLLTHLNADTTWLLSLPFPSKLTTPQSQWRRRKYFHILIDPWLAGSQSDVAGFFSTQWHATESCVGSIAGVEEVVRGIEAAVLGDFSAKEAEEEKEDEDLHQAHNHWIGAVIVSHEFTDHMHKETLLEVASAIPVFATSKAAGIIRSWGHFGNVVDVPRFGGDWRTSAQSGLLPEWIGISRVAYEGLDLLYYHSAIMIVFSATRERGKSRVERGGMESWNNDEVEQAEGEAIIYTPHGVSPENLTPLTTASPRIQTLALLHGLQDIQINSSWISRVKAQLNKGAHNGLKVQRLLKAKYWVGTHDEVKKGGGVVSWFLERKTISLKDAMDEEEKLEVRRGKVKLGEVRFVDLGNGESLVLE